MNGQNGYPLIPLSRYITPGGPAGDFEDLGGQTLGAGTFRLESFAATNARVGSIILQFFDTDVLPVDSVSAPIWTCRMPGTSSINVDFDTLRPLAFETGLAFGFTVANDFVFEVPGGDRGLFINLVYRSF